MGMLEHDLSPGQPMLHALPPQSTPCRQLDAPHEMSQDEPLVQSTRPPLQLLSPHSTRQGIPNGHLGAQSGLLQPMTHTPAWQLPFAAPQAALSQGGGPLPPLPALPPPPPAPAAPPPPPATPPAPPPALPPLSAPAPLPPVLLTPPDDEPPLLLPALGCPALELPAIGAEPPTGS